MDDLPPLRGQKQRCVQQSAAFKRRPVRSSILRAGRSHRPSPGCEPAAREGEVWHRVTTRDGQAVDVPGRYQLHEMEALVSIIELREADGAAHEKAA